MSRPYNFAPGPSAIPDSVLERAAGEMLDWGGTGTSVLEMSHRGKHFLQIHEKALADFKSLLGLDADHEVLFMQGGASAQNAIIPMNILGPSAQCDYVNTGHWSTKSIAEARNYGDVHVAASSADDGFSRIPEASSWSVRSTSSYLHICGNETIHGVEYFEWPSMSTLGAPDVPLVVDVSSHVLSRPMDFSNIDLAYGGAQKNIGPSGLTFVILKRSLIADRRPSAMAHCPSVFDYRKVLANDSLLNTPCTFAIYMAGLMFEWIANEGGVAAMGERNRKKAQTLYAALDASSFYSTRVRADCRSQMNIPFFLPDERLYEVFLKEATEAGLLNLKGHKALGGLRASLYNAMPLSGVEALVAFLKRFEREHG